MKASLALGLGFLVFLSLAFAVAAQPGPGHQFKGDALVNGFPAVDGLLVEAFIDGELKEASITGGGRYGYEPNIFMIVEDADEVLDGKPIEFFIEGIAAGESTFVNADHDTLHLSVSGDLGVCGDTVCSSEESCSTCSSDCGSCPPPPSGPGSSGGGGGGGSFTPPSTSTDDSSEEPEVCTEDWDCTEWFNCHSVTNEAGTSAIEERICVDRNSCGTEFNKPAEAQPCILTDEELIPVTPDGPLTPPPALSFLESFFGLFSGTGLVSQDDAPVAAGAVIVIVVVVIGGLIYWRKR